MKRTLALILLLSCAAIAQPHDAVLNVTYPFPVDSSGFVELRALAGFNDSGNFMCYGTSVNATVNGENYSLDPQVGCYYTKFLQLADGDYSISFNASYPEPLESKSSSYVLSVSNWTKPYVKIYSPAPGQSFRPSDWVFIEAAGFIKNSMIDGTMRADIINSLNEPMNSAFLSSSNKVFKGWIKLNVSDGDYYLRLTFSSGQFTVQKSVGIKANASAAPGELTSGSISMIYPRENMTFDKNETIPFELEFRDFNELLVKGAAVTMSIYKGESLVDTVRFNESAYSYVAQYVFTEAGRYELRFRGVSERFEAESTYSITVGNATEVAQAENFVVKILVPRADVYATNSEIIARARVRLNGEQVSSDVRFFVDSSEVAPHRDSYGDYVFILSSLLQGTHSIKAIAEKDGMSAVDYVEFAVSDHVLSVSWLDPDENGTAVIAKGDRLVLKASVNDESGDAVAGVFVIAEIIEPNGREIQVRLFESEDTPGVYLGDYYPSLEGTYKVHVTAAKTGYVARVKDVLFGIALEKQQIIPSLDVSTVLLIILAMAIVIFVLAFLKLIF
ncbi:MAG: hypothetical protein QXO69_00140 [archaeon]